VARPARREPQSRDATASIFRRGGTVSFPLRGRGADPDTAVLIEPATTARTIAAIFTQNTQLTITVVASAMRSARPESALIKPTHITGSSPRIEAAAGGARAGKAQIDGCVHAGDERQPTACRKTIGI
jgi:hypothetical protein